MFGFGLAFVGFGVASLFIAKSLSRSSSDIMAFAELPPLIAGVVLLLVGGACMVFGLQ
jgi:predicted membrane channel-forming protein YqfA (hemolysin III family)